MRYGVSIVVAAALSAGVLLVHREAAEAQMTCGSAYQDCVSRAADPKKCIQARALCMKTGRWIGPESGRDYGLAIRTTTAGTQTLSCRQRCKRAWGGIAGMEDRCISIYGCR